MFKDKHASFPSYSLFAFEERENLTRTTARKTQQPPPAGCNEPRRPSVSLLSASPLQTGLTGFLAGEALLPSGELDTDNEAAAGNGTRPKGVTCLSVDGWAAPGKPGRSLPNREHVETHDLHVGLRPTGSALLGSHLRISVPSPFGDDKGPSSVFGVVPVSRNAG